MNAPPIPSPKRPGMPTWAWVLIGFAVCGCAGVPILAAILFPVFAQARYAAMKTQTLSHIKQLGTGAVLFEGDNDGLLPNVSSEKQIYALMAPYVKNMSVIKSMNPKGHEILFNFKLGGHTQDQLKDSQNTIMFYEESPWPDGKRAVVFYDSHAKLLSQDEWQDAKPLMDDPIRVGAKTVKPLSPGYQAALAKFYDRVIVEGNLNLSEKDLKFLTPDFTTGEQAKQ